MKHSTSLSLYTYKQANTKDGVSKCKFRHAAPIVLLLGLSYIINIVKHSLSYFRFLAYRS